MKKLILLNFFLLSSSITSAPSIHDKIMFIMDSKENLEKRLREAGFDTVIEKTNIHEILGGKEFDLKALLDIEKQAEKKYLETETKLTKEKNLLLLQIILGDQFEIFFSELEKLKKQLTDSNLNH